MKGTDIPTRPASKLRAYPAASSASSSQGVAAVAGSFASLLADVFALYVKTKNFHWHMSRPAFSRLSPAARRAGEQIFAMTDDIAERARKIGGTSLRSIGDIARHQRLQD